MLGRRMGSNLSRLINALMKISYKSLQANEGVHTFWAEEWEPIFKLTNIQVDTVTGYTLWGRLS